MSNIKVPKKLIEVALPLDDINAACTREKSIRHGHPSTLHLWWARRPLAAARAVIFAQMVNDPGGERGWTATKTKKQADEEREKLFDIIRDLVKWENTNNEEVLEKAREEIRKSWRETCELNKGKEGFDPEKLPAFHDPFAGGGAIPLEAQRLGLESYASDLNPVPVMINKAMIEIPPKFAGQKPIGPIPKGEKQGKLKIVEDWSGAKGLAEDVRRYGHWMREEAFKRIGHLYPKVLITKEMAEEREDLKNYVGKELTVIAWLWARTVKSPNPAFSHVDVPLVKSFVLSSKKGKDAWIEPIIDGDSYQFVVRKGKKPAEALDGTVQRSGGTCLLSGTPMPFPYIRSEASSGMIGEKLMAVVVEGEKERVYLSPTPEIETIAKSATPLWAPTTETEGKCRVNIGLYGMTTWDKLFTPRQLTALTSFSDLLNEVRQKIILDAKENEISDDNIGINDGGIGATAYSDAIITYLTFSVDKVTDYWSSICSWHSSKELIRNTFGRQAIPMVWDYVEANPFCSSSGNWLSMLNWTSKAVTNFPAKFGKEATQQDAQTQTISENKVVSTDPPYYDNISYADLSDFFYVWMRRSLKSIYPNIFTTMAVPKDEELVATPYRHGSKDKAEQFFLDGMTEAMSNLAEKAHSAFPVTIYYAFKQDANVASTGWETFLAAVLKAGFIITGTWPMRTELANRMIGSGANALASSVVLVCEKRDKNAETISRRQFQRELRETMPDALETMIGGTTGQSPIAPVDLAQAAIGPGMAVFSKYASVLNQDGTEMSVHDALVLINKAITDYLNPDSGSSDEETLFCDAWFDQYGWGNGAFGEADTLARAKGTSVDRVSQAGVIEATGGRVRLLRWTEYPTEWKANKKSGTPIWEACHHIIRKLLNTGWSEAGQLLAQMPDIQEPIRQLAYHLYTLCERKGWAEEARAYNSLITSWHEIVAASIEVGHVDEQIQMDL